jgi:hypothetical protein
VSGWRHLSVGGGGNVDGQSIPRTGVRFERTDVGGAYLWGTSNKQWNQVVTQSSVPPADFGYYPANTSANQNLTSATGVVEIAGCPSDASCAYMIYDGLVLVSTNVDPANPGNLTWQDTGFTPIPDTSNDGTRDSGPFMAVDPNNSGHVIVGTEANGLFETLNGTNPGGATWAAIATSSVPRSTGTTSYRIAFDATSPTATCHTGSGTCSSTAYIWTSGGGTGGVYVTTNAGGSWAETTGGPATVNHLKVSAAAAGGGNVWATDGSGGLWRYSAHAWAQIPQVSNCETVAINPNDGSHVVGLTGSGDLYASTNGDGASPTFGGPYSYALVASDAPWQAWMLLNREYLGAGGEIDFDPLNNDVLISDGGQGVWTTTFPSANFTWTSMVAGIEELVFARIAVGAEGAPSFGAEDESGCQLSISAVGNATTCFPQASLGFLQYTSGLSVAPGTSFMVAKTSADFGAGSDISGYSTDGFKSSYMPFNTWNATVASTAVANNGSGLVRVTVPSTTGLTTWSAGAGSLVCSLTSLIQYVNTPLGPPVTEPCYAATVVDATHFDLQGTQYDAQMSTAGYSYIFFVSAAAFDSWNGTLMITNVASDGGSVQVTTAFGGGGLPATQNPVCISGVTMKGATAVNGCWIATNPTGKSFDLGPKSAFVAGDSYVTGGEASTWGTPGGSIAAASTTNWTSVGGDRTYPLCTTDSGAHWSQVTVPGIPLTTTTVTGGPYMAGATSIQVASGGGASGYQIYIPLTSGRVFTDVNATVSGNTVTLTHPVPPGDSIATGAAVSQSTSWPFAAYLNSHPIVADQVAPNTVVAMATDLGLAKWTDCGPATVVASDPTHSTFLKDTGYNVTLKAVPGESGHLFWTSGPVGGMHPASTQLWRTCNGNNSTANSVTLSAVPGIYEPLSIGFGHAAPGMTYPAIYVVGWYSADNSVNDAEYGIWQSVDDANNGSTGTCASGNTWKKVGDYPGGWGTFPMDFEGDPFVYGPVYYSGSFGAFTATLP